MKKVILSVSSILFAVCSCMPVADEPTLLETPVFQAEHAERIVRDGYEICYSYDYNTPLWVAWELTADEASAKGKGRADEFAPEPALGSYSPHSYDYSRSGYDRGHMAPAADFRWTESAMEGTFVMSNVCPQNHVLNAGSWNDLERQCRKWAQNYDKLWICCGPIYGSNPKTIGKDVEISVPESFFKVVLKPWKDGYEAIGFVMPNSPCEDDFFNYAVSVDQVEEMTGMDFFALLPDNIEDKIEGELIVKNWKHYLVSIGVN